MQQTNYFKLKDGVCCILYSNELFKALRVTIQYFWQYVDPVRPDDSTFHTTRGRDLKNTMKDDKRKERIDQILPKSEASFSVIL